MIKVNPIQVMNAVVASICDELTDEELVVLNLTAQLGTDPHNRLFDYEKVAPLFTENDGTKMHEETRDALARIVCHRLI